MPTGKSTEDSIELANLTPASALEFCNEGNCLEFAQTSDPRSPDLLKFKCVRHEAAARARGETGKRRPQPLPSRLSRQPMVGGRPGTAAKPVLTQRPVYEFDSAGTRLRQWANMPLAVKATGLTRRRLLYRARDHQPVESGLRYSFCDVLPAAIQEAL